MKQRETWFQQLANRLMWASRILITDAPVVRLDNGIDLDLRNNRVILHGDVGLHVVGNLSLTATGEVITKGGVNDDSTGK